MDLKTIVAARIHPAIGIARVGNAEPGKHGKDYFVGPEVPYPTPAPRGGYRDEQGRLKRQAARFRIFGYDAKGQVVGELTDHEAKIEWQVHVANKKAAWYNFDVALDLPEANTVRSARRNAHIRGEDRAKLAIDPGSRAVSKSKRRAAFDTGKFFGVRVYLGEIRYEAGGRLLFLGGKGKSAPVSKEYSITTFANNAGWHDDTSDGPVSATVRIGTHPIPVDSAWVVTAPPNYAPDLVATQPLYDVIFNMLVRGGMVKPPEKVSFTRDILPIFRQFGDAQWVNAGFAAKYGNLGLTNLMRPELLEKLATEPVKKAGQTIDDPYLELRRQIFLAFRDPQSRSFDPVGWPPLYGDAFFFLDDPPSPRAAFAITRTSYAHLKDWAEGKFDDDYHPKARDPQSLEEIKKAQRPEALDRAALHFCIGGPFHPGCEATWNIRRISMYRSAFRLRERLPGTQEPDYGDFMTADLATADGGPLSASGPGDVTKWLAVPWQTDTASCLAGYGGTEFQPDDLIPAFWPSRVPNTVLSEASYNVVIDPSQTVPKRRAAFHHRENWLRQLPTLEPYLESLKSMIEHFHYLGVIERREKNAGEEFPAVMYVESLPPGKIGALSTVPAETTSLQIQRILKARLRDSSQ